LIVSFASIENGQERIVVIFFVRNESLWTSMQEIGNLQKMHQPISLNGACLF